MNRRAFLAVVPPVVLAGCAARLGLADRVEVIRKYVRLHPLDDEEPIDAAVRRYDPAEGPYYDGEIHEALADEIDEDEPIRISRSSADRLDVHYDIVEYRVRVCGLNVEDPEACEHTTLVLEDFNDVEPGDIIDLVYGNSGAGLVSIHERHEDRR